MQKKDKTQRYKLNQEKLYPWYLIIQLLHDEYMPWNEENVVATIKVEKYQCAPVTKKLVILN